MLSKVYFERVDSTCHAIFSVVRDRRSLSSLPRPGTLGYMTAEDEIQLPVRHLALWVRYLKGEFHVVSGRNRLVGRRLNGVGNITHGEPNLGLVPECLGVVKPKYNWASRLTAVKKVQLAM